MPIGGWWLANRYREDWEEYHKMYQGCLPDENYEKGKHMNGEQAKTHYVAPGQPHVWVWKRCSFDAAHQLPLYQGACSRVHGHTYFVELGVLCSIDPATGMGLDLKELGEFLKSNVEALFDHQFINDRIPGQHSTAEGIARYILEVADRYFNKSFVKVRVYETPDSWVEMDSSR